MKYKTITVKEAKELGVWSKFCKKQDWNEDFLVDIGVNDNSYFAIPEELFINDLKKSSTGIGINLEKLRVRNYQLTDRQVQIIQGALDRHYYNCKDDGDYNQMEECIEIGKTLTEQNLPEHGGDVK